MKKGEVCQKKENQVVRTQYPADFEEFWSIFDRVVEAGLGTKGNKKRAFKRYQEKQIGPDDFEFIREAVEEQIQAKLARRASGLFDPDFMQIEGWINNERWDDEISGPVGRLCEADRKRAAELQQYLQGGMGESVAGPDSSKASIEGGRGNVIDMRVLANQLRGSGAN